MDDPVREAALAEDLAPVVDAASEVAQSGEIAAVPAETAHDDTSAMTSVSAAESGATLGAAEVPNAVPAAVESTTEPASAPSAAGGDTTSPIVVSSGEPLHVRIAVHLEAIYQMVREHTDALSKLV